MVARPAASTAKRPTGSSYPPNASGSGSNGGPGGGERERERERDARLTVVHGALDTVSSAFAASEVVFDDRDGRTDPTKVRAAVLASSDPLTRARAPPANESAAARTQRIASEAEAKRISDMIDVELARQRAAEGKGRKPVKILLLGE